MNVRAIGGWLDALARLAGVSREVLLDLTAIEVVERIRRHVAC